MYNFQPAATIPNHLSLELSAFLSPWFSSIVLEKGLSLLQEGALSHFFIHRQGAGGLFRGKHPLFIGYEKTDRIHQGFTLRQNHCQVCNLPPNAKRCEHLAALCILSMPGDMVPPMPLHFAQSTWHKIAAFCHDWTNEIKGSFSCSENPAIHINQVTPEGSIAAEISSLVLQNWFFFTPKNEQQETETSLAKAHNLYQNIQLQTLSNSEQQLNAAGMSSLAFKRDTSLWTRLCLLFYALSNDATPKIHFNGDSGRVHLSFESAPLHCKLQIILPRNRTIEMLNLFSESKDQFPLLPPARSGFQASFNDSNQLLVRRIITDAEEQTYRLQDLSDCKFGNHYYFHTQGFLPVTPLAAAAKISKPTTQEMATPLFAVLKKDEDFLVDEHETEDFIAKNRQALAHPDNQTAPDIFDYQVKTVPDSITLHSFHEDQDWYYLSCDYKLGNSSISLAQLLQQRSKKSQITRGSTSLKLKSGPLSWFLDLAEKRQWSDKDGRRGVQLSRYEFMSLVSTVEKVESCLKESSQFHHRLQTILQRDTWGDSSALSSTPAHFRDYQKNGLAWLHTLFDLGIGGLLADDMGLGKTHQGLALLELVRQRSTSQPTLVICPASVLSHWQDKIDRFYPELDYSIYYGPNRHLEEELSSGLLLTTYGVARSDRQELIDIPFSLILIDEIQYLKNRNTDVHQTVQALNSQVKIGLTGTPIENSLSDLYALFDICLPGFFGPFKQFNTTYLNPITKYDDHKQRERLRRIIHPFILRRSRSQVLTELPELIEDTRTCVLTPDQLALYNQLLEEYQRLLDGLADEGERIDYLNVLTLITRLKQICNHPCLLTGETNPDSYTSGKWDLLVELLQECLANKLKVVIFSQYTGMLALINTYLDREGIGRAGIQGNMAIKKRKQEIERFTTDKECPVFCSSLLAGGTGIDLIAAQVVIHYDRWWNPAKEEQATARVHRMGQKEVVQLFQLVTMGTIEEKIHAIITKKQALASSLISEDEGGLLKTLDREQLLGLFQ